MKVFIGPYEDDGKDPYTEIHIDDYDVWSMDCTLAKIIEPMLVKLANQKHGVPMVDNEDVPEELHASEEQYNHEIDLKRWDWVINEMIWAFHQKTIDWESQYYSGEHDIYFEDIGNGYSEMKRGPNDTFKVDTEGMKKHQARMSNGFRLFGKYYESLWD